MQPLNEILGGVQTAENEAQRRNEELKQQARKDLRKAQKDIKAGRDSTGSALYDGVVVLFGEELVDRSLVLPNYETVSEQLKDKTGEPVVAIHRRLENAEHVSIPAPNWHPRKMILETFAAGELNGEEIVFNYRKGQAFLPTKHYVFQRKGYRSRANDSVVYESNLLIDDVELLAFEGFRLGGWLGLKLDLQRANVDTIWEDTPSTVMDVLVGYAGIQEWLDAGDEHSLGRNGTFGRIRAACGFLGMKPPEPATHAQRRYLER